MRKELIAYRDPKSPVSETFKTLRTNLQFMNSGKGLNSLLVTSTLPEEGKSWVTANLAITFAQTGKRVILVDSDMRKGRQYNIFGIMPRPGLSNYLSGICEDFEVDPNDIVNYIQRTEVENLYIMPAGDVPPNPSELLVSTRMIEMVEELKQMCDIVIFDGTPSLLVTDAIIISRLVESSLIIAEHKKTKMENLEKVKKAIENVGGKVGGVVFNKVPVSAQKYESIYYYGKSSNNKAQSKKDALNRRVATDMRKNKTVKKDELKKSDNVTVNHKETSNNKTDAKKEKVHNIEENKKTNENIKNTNIQHENQSNKQQNLNTQSINPQDVEIHGKVTVDKTQEILNQINKYLEDEKSKLNKGDF